MSNPMLNQGLADDHAILHRKLRKSLFSRQRKTSGEIIFKIALTVFFILFALTFLYPFWYTIILSFSGIDEALSLGLHLFLDRWRTEAYEFIFSSKLLGHGYVNSIAKTAVGASLTVVVTLMAAYPLSKKNLPGRNAITIYILITMFFSGGLIPTYLLIRAMGLLDRFVVLILPTLAAGFSIIIVRNFLMTIDPAYEESAFIDGANYMQILFRIMVPLSKPVMAVIFLWSAVAHWNAWFDWLVYMRSDSKIVLQMILRRLLMKQMQILAAIMEFGSAGDLEQLSELPSEAVKAATTLITIGPIILLYPFLQRYFIKGIFIGSLKG